MGQCASGGQRAKFPEENWTRLEKVSEKPFDSDNDALVVDAYQEEHIEMESDAIPEGIYGMALASLIHDAAHTANEGKSFHGKCMRGGRLLSSCLMVLIALSLQAYLLVSTKTMITPENVKSIRHLYSRYEATMYGGHVQVNTHNHSRGVDGYFNESNFELMSTKDRHHACRIPLSQPTFLFVVLMIWTMTVFKHMRNNINLLLRLLALDTARSVHVALVPGKDPDSPNERHIVALTYCQKFGVAIIQLLVIGMYADLLWLGSRWLVATVGFGDLLLNSLALEFIIDLPELIYCSMVPKLTQIETQNTYLGHLLKKEPARFCNMFGMYFLGLVAAVLVLSYMYVFQRVLPGYNFDVHHACVDLLKEEMVFDKTGKHP